MILSSGFLFCSEGYSGRNITDLGNASCIAFNRFYVTLGTRVNSHLERESYIFVVKYNRPWINFISSTLFNLSIIVQFFLRHQC